MYAKSEIILHAPLKIKKKPRYCTVPKKGIAGLETIIKPERRSITPIIKNVIFIPSIQLVCSTHPSKLKRSQHILKQSRKLIQKQDSSVFLQ